MGNYKPKVVNFNVDWFAIKDACMQTIGKEAGAEPSSEWKRKLLICRHSPIRRSLISVKWEEIPSYVSTHFCRHSVGVTPYVSTSREDRTGVPREERKQTDMVSMQLDLNIQSLFNIMEKRLCKCSDINTIKYAKGLAEAIKEYDEDIYWSLVPQCVRCGSCVEPFGKCEFYKGLMTGHTLEEQQDIMKRYDIYNEHREKVKVKKL
ncbi:MAG: hypothetical protein MSA56_05370 [Clostridium sp.]|nr:hypothetical protein [Clostridium sp.]